MSLMYKINKRSLCGTPQDIVFSNDLPSWIRGYCSLSKEIIEAIYK